MGLYHYVKYAIKYKLNVNIQRMREEKTHFMYSEFSHPPCYIYTHDDDAPHLHAAYTIF